MSRSSVNDPPPPIPDPEDAGGKKLFAFYGLCAFYASVMEHGLVNLAVGLQAKGLSVVTGDAVEAAFDLNLRKTLGTLIGDVKKHIPVPPELDSLLASALSERNYLIHRFFRTHDIGGLSAPGRRAMIEELRRMIVRFREADQAVEGIALPLWDTLGVTNEVREREYAAMMSEAEEADRSESS